MKSKRRKNCEKKIEDMEEMRELLHTFDLPSRVRERIDSILKQEIENIELSFRDKVRLKRILELCLSKNTPNGLFFERIFLPNDQFLGELEKLEKLIPQKDHYKFFSRIFKGETEFIYFSGYVHMLEEI
jgi:predicted metal-binding protein